MTKSFTFNDPDYTALIRIYTHKSVELIPTSDVSVWRERFYYYMVKEQDKYCKAHLEKCHNILICAVCYASSVGVSCCADYTGISIMFDFKFKDSASLNAFMHEMN